MSQGMCKFSKGAPTDFHEATFNHIGGQDLAPEGPRTPEEREQLRAPKQSRHELRVCVPPPSCERLGIGLHGRVIPPPPPCHAEQIAKLVDPTALMRHAWIDRLERYGHPGTAIRHEQL